MMEMNQSKYAPYNHVDDIFYGSQYYQLLAHHSWKSYSPPK
jgi:hypothetical protein